jgi:ABC-type spermidine/putrescine transport system permease subunit I
VSAQATSLPRPAAESGLTRSAGAGWLGLGPALGLVGITMVLPVLALIWTSVGAGEFTLEHYARILTSPAYRIPLINTFAIAGMVTVGCIVFAYPVAYIMATLGPIATRIVTLVVLLPFWTSALVRTTAWIILLQRRGVLNTLLESTGLIDEPLTFVFNLSGVLIGMIHVLMPFMVLPLWAAFRSIDRNMLSAAESLGARPISVFRHVLAPLTAPGVVAGAIIVFMNALGFYITPALLGGPKQTMIAMMIQFHLQERLDWAMAAALSITLLAMTLAVFALFQRFFGIDRLWGGAAGGEQTDTLATASAYRRSPAGWFVVAAGVLVGVFLIAPIVLVFPMSLSHSPFLVFPPPSYSWRWYLNLTASSKWADALGNSLVVAAIAVPLATGIGTAAAVGVTRVAQRWRTAIETLLVLPLVVPAIVFAVALYYLFAPIGLANSRFGLALGHAVLGLPFVFLTVRAGLRGFDGTLELAASSLGAPWRVMFREIMLPHLAPGIAAGAMFAFITSFDEVILAIFLTDVRSRTLPKLMFEGVAHEIDPTITAVASLLILFSILFFLLSLLVKPSR